MFVLPKDLSNLTHNRNLSKIYNNKIIIDIISINKTKEDE